ncbi:hypothetical protein [Rhodococcus spongiicola]|uniref:Uncharacterized protein n=1 Tax=Rhodococcus spongiicola TaxID=2487352 RepID=A0A438B5Q6_9NOCA|nr:hypothetical protein [Rhodococcus spongiicola]RVW06277.1 hypothetical protein EF834_02160 [Rhodococcus spongiicola]
MDRQAGRAGPGQLERVDPTARITITEPQGKLGDPTPGRCLRDGIDDDLLAGLTGSRIVATPTTRPST